MRFNVIGRGIRAVGTIGINRFPTALLRRDNWDDYNFETTFGLSLYLSKDKVVEVGDVKILRRGYGEGSTPMPETSFSRLGDDYCSLGQAFSYYETLFALGQSVYEPLLRGLRDVVTDPQRLASFKSEDGFGISLLRASSAASALEDAPSLFGIGAKPAVPGGLQFSFETKVGGETFVIPFDFGGDAPLPGRINVLIGYNGTGKTRLLGNLAMVIHRSGDKNAGARKRRYGHIVGPDVRFGSVIAISYSAFDTFELPEKPAERRRAKERGDVFGYAYFGLRTYLPKRGAKHPWALKRPDDIEHEFAVAVGRASSKGRRELFIRAMAPLAHEPSFNRIGVGQFLVSDPSGLGDIFASLSSGHKIVVNIIAQLVAQTEKRSLVLLDEPESHLHPPLLAALLRGMRVVLEDRDSFAIIATHSPVVLQETPGRHVRILRRFQTKTVVADPEIETFGENIGLLTRHAFGLETSSTDFHAVLESLARDRDVDEIEDLFPNGMSSQARAFVLSVKRSAK